MLSKDGKICLVNKVTGIKMIKESIILNTCWMSYGRVDDSKHKLLYQIFWKSLNAKYHVAVFNYSRFTFLIAKIEKES